MRQVRKDQVKQARRPNVSQCGCACEWVDALMRDLQLFILDKKVKPKALELRAGRETRGLDLVFRLDHHAAQVAIKVELVADAKRYLK